jgi:DNA (cytosine-5)-methyltransferase 1
VIGAQHILPLASELLVVLFAGGGGSCTGIEQAVGRHVDIAINHDEVAISLHKANHPQARHYVSDVFDVDPREAAGGRAIGLLHASPDCTHHSQARGGQPRSSAIRSLSWVVHRWAGTVRPRLITLENVEQILQWSPLVAKRDPKTGRVMLLDGTVAAAGVHVPLNQQFLVPCTRRKGKNWQHFVEGLRRMGYAVQWRTLCAADFGAPTTRERLFMVARCDGEPIVWPEPTHAKRKSASAKAHPARKPWRAAAECIDWSTPCPSIFTRKKPLAEATLRRVAKGIDRYVLKCADPFIVRICQQGSLGKSMRSIDEPITTVTSKNEHALVAPTLVQMGYGERPGQAPRALDLQQPLGTVVSGGGKHGLVSPVLVPTTHQGSDRVNDACEPLPTITTAHRGEVAVVSAFMAQMNGGFYEGAGRAADQPLSTTTGRGTQQQLVTALMTHAYTSNSCGGEGDLRKPAKTITTGGHHALVQCELSPNDEEGALRVAAFLMRYYGQGGQWGDVREPMATITTKDRLALVTVLVHGTPYVIVDIGLRMLQPRELFTAQGFPLDYVIDRGADGKPLSKGAQTRMCGNSVSPPQQRALVLANYSDAGAPIAQQRVA